MKFLSTLAGYNLTNNKRITVIQADFNPLKSWPNVKHI
jgi:hypothetical protein